MAVYYQKLDDEEQRAVSCMFFGDFILRYYEEKIDRASLFTEIGGLLESDSVHPAWKSVVLNWVVSVFQRFSMAERQKLTKTFQKLGRSEGTSWSLNRNAVRAEYWFVVRQYREFMKALNLEDRADFPTRGVVEELLANKRAEKHKEALEGLLEQVLRYQEGVRVFLLSSSVRANDGFWISTIVDRKEWVEELRTHFRDVAASKDHGVDARLGALSILVEHFRENHGPAIERLIAEGNLGDGQLAIAKQLSVQCRGIGTADGKGGP